MLRDLQERSSGRVGTALPAAKPQPVTLAPVYYPGTPIASEAVPIRVGAGESRDDLDFTLDFVPVVEVQGRIVTADGSAPPAVQLTLTPIGPSLPRPTLGPISRQSPDGSFAVTNVTPGRYVLFARESIAKNVVGSPAGGALWAMADVNVDAAGGEVRGLTLTLRRTLTFAGRIVFSGAPPPPAGAVSKIRVGLVRVDRSLAEGTAGGAQPAGLPVPSFATAGADGSFAVHGFLPGLYVPSAFVPGAPQWRLRSAILDGRDLLDVPLDVGASAGDVSGVVLTFSEWRSELAGVLQDASGRPAPGHTVIVFPTDKALWRSSRRLRTTRPASDGHFSFADLPGGEYRLAALTDIPGDDWRRASFLEQALAASVQVTLGEGANVTQNLRVR
jgi:hypothetical protein